MTSKRNQSRFIWADGQLDMLSVYNATLVKKALQKEVLLQYHIKTILGSPKNLSVRSVKEIWIIWRTFSHQVL